MNRVKLILIDPNFLIDALNWSRTSRATVFTIVSGEPLPGDAKVVDVHYDFNRGKLVATVRSESFEPVPAGEPIPFFNEPMKEVVEIVDPLDAQFMARAIQVADWLDALSLESEWLEDASKAVANCVVLSKDRWSVKEAKECGYKPSPELEAAWENTARNAERLMRLNSLLGELVATRRRQRHTEQQSNPSKPLETA